MRKRECIECGRTLTLVSNGCCRSCLVLPLEHRRDWETFHDTQRSLAPPERIDELAALARARKPLFGPASGQ